MTSTKTIIVWNEGDEHDGKRFVVDGGVLWGPMVGDDDYERSLNGEEPIEWLKNHKYSGHTFKYEWAERDAGCYYPRFYKGGYFIDLFREEAGPDYDLEAAALSYEQETILLDELKAICRVTSPDDNTSGAYGSSIRNLLILASTEVEALIKGTLAKNGYQRADGKHWTMTDYLKVAGPMRLGEYGMKLRVHRRYAEFRPFAGWVDNNSKPDWYNAYNAVKHDRESAMSQATLKHAISAVAAVNVMLLAQYGEERPLSMAFFQRTSTPSWSPIERTYSNPLDPEAWTAVRYLF